MIDVYVLYGPPGSGKGTVCSLLPTEHCLGVGGLLRARQKGLDGTFVSDSYVNRLVKETLSEKQEYVVLDGYPRTQGQVDFLMNLQNVRIVRVYHLICSDAALIQRLSGRQTCSCGATYHPILKPSVVKNQCDLCAQPLFTRQDDAPEIIQKRLKQFHLETNPLLAKFGTLVHPINVEDDFVNAVQEIVGDILCRQNKVAAHSQKQSQSDKQNRYR
ncbi:MAG: adenylate kinase family protein [Alphaproteobacteria bacterium]